MNEYLARLKKGEKCFEELYEYTNIYVRYMAYKYLNDRSRVDDVVIETYSKVLNNIEKFKTSGNGYGWICKIAHNEALQENKRDRRKELKETEVKERPSPEQRYDLARAVERLSEPDRQLLECRVFECLKYREIKVLLGYTPVQAYRKLSQIYATLKKDLE